ncbi:MAG: tRNA (5-methylaminomethyl-2-thiouridine)(34)-methyltransferase MnmD [Bacteroidales bacterium]|nr:tRNA (5-methylaminomethyl-2-thiouridine)(34)-methyltransferase MnmD [Bacteroidales bacterium]
MKNPHKLELINTSDGSHTLRLVGADEQYHSVNGALQESQHVFIQAGLMKIIHDIKPLNLLEVGMGTGLNALLTVTKSVENESVVFYDAVEPFPLDEQWTEKLNYTGFFPGKWVSQAFEMIHNKSGSQYNNLYGLFNFRCFNQKIQELKLETDHYHLVYFDAFGPDTQPEMWTDDVFEKISNSMKFGGILVTYCAKGAVRRAMRSAGLKVERLPGPPGKREMTRAEKI